MVLLVVKWRVRARINRSLCSISKEVGDPGLRISDACVSSNHRNGAPILRFAPSINDSRVLGADRVRRCPIGIRLGSSLNHRIPIKGDDVKRTRLTDAPSRRRDLRWIRITAVAALAAIVFGVPAGNALLRTRSTPVNRNADHQPTGSSSAETLEPVTPSTRSARSPIGSESAGGTTHQARSRCHNSYDPSCGRFYWATPPHSNEPMTATVRYSPEHPVVGQEIAFTVTVSDPDAPFLNSFMGSMWGDGTGVGLAPAMCIVNRPVAFGPWSPPQGRSGMKQFVYRHEYRQSGNFLLSFWGTSASGSPWDDRCGGPDPYKSQAQATTRVMVSSSSAGSNP